MSRSILLDKIRRASRGEGPELPTQAPEFPHYDDLILTFQKALEKVGGRFWDVRGEDHLPQALESILERTQAQEIYWEGEELFQRHSLPFRLRDPLAFQRGLLTFSYHYGGRVRFPLLLNSQPYRREHLARIRVSVSSATWGVAETGTVVHEVSPGKGRLLSILPPAHVCLLSESRLLHNHQELWERLDFSRGSLKTLITGPSRTADIEKTLVLGVHGPPEWFVLLTP